MAIERRMNIIAPLAAHIELSAKMPRVYAIASFDDYHSPKTQRKMRNLLRAHSHKYVTESVCLKRDSAGIVYGLLVYSTQNERVECFNMLGE